MSITLNPVPQCLRAHAPPCALALGGLDPGGGAGILADMRRIGAAGAFGCAVVTLLTVQSTEGAPSARPVPPARSSPRPVSCWDSSTSRQSNWAPSAARRMCGPRRGFSRATTTYRWSWIRRCCPLAGQAPSGGGGDCALTPRPYPSGDPSHRKRPRSGISRRSPGSHRARRTGGRQGPCENGRSGSAREGGHLEARRPPMSSSLVTMSSS